MIYNIEPPKTVFISGQKYFAAEIYRLCVRLGMDVIGVCTPVGDKYLKPLALRDGIPIINAGTLDANTVIKADLGITAHSFDYIGKATRLAMRLGWLSYHPSLLPRHRGRSAIEWAIKMRDPITGGSTFWLNSGVDRGDIFLQDWCFIDPVLYSTPSKEAAAKLWRSHLLPIGKTLMRRSLSMLLKGEAVKIKQDPKFSTFEPSTDIKDIYKPDLLLLEHPKANLNC